LRAVIHRSAGQRHGPITRLVSPGQEGRLIRPFVFLDYLEAPEGAGPRFGFHPHSGIATLTFPLTFDIEHETSTGQIDSVKRGGLEWVLAGGGIWHRGRPLGSGPISGFQLWFAMPPSHELAQSQTRFIEPADVPRCGPVTVLLGAFEERTSPLHTPLQANCLWVELSAGETWSYAAPRSHQIAWCFVQRGLIDVGSHRLGRELAIFEEGEGALKFHAQTPSAFLLGSCARSAHDLVLGAYSVHTSQKALDEGERRIAQIGESLRAQGRL
jgi:redox-sensitive bicupin YhaK (pirin superfamily)